MKIEYWSDFTCPYCYVGSNRMDQALEMAELSNKVDFKFRTFQLDPVAPKKTEAKFIDHMTGGKEELEPYAIKQLNFLSKQAAKDGIEANFLTAQFTNTHAAHKLVKYVARKDSQQAKLLIRKLFELVFVANKNIANEETLKKLGLEVGLPLQEAEEAIASEKLEQEILQDREQAKKLKISTLPFYLIDNQYVITGIKPVKILVKKLGNYQKG